jgi:hypothetical protein
VRAATYDSLVRSNGTWLASIIQDPELAQGFEAAVSSWQRVNDDQRPRLMYLLTQLFRHWENAFFQYQQGTLAPNLWETWEGIILSYFRQPGIQEWWVLRRAAYATEFRRFLESSTPPSAAIRTTRQIHSVQPAKSERK